jgi:hypothetical protein
MTRNRLGLAKRLAAIGAALTALVLFTPAAAHAYVNDVSGNVFSCSGCWTNDDEIHVTGTFDVYFGPSNLITQVSSQGIVALNIRPVGSGGPFGTTAFWSGTSGPWDLKKIIDNPSSGIQFQASACCWSASGGGDTFWAGTVVW